MSQRTVEHLGFKCLGPTITSQHILNLRQELDHHPSLLQLRDMLHAISGTMRLKILYLLHREPELCVCDLSDILGETVSAVSHQLKVLRRCNLVETRRDAKTIFYSLNAPVVYQYLNLDKEATLTSHPKVALNAIGNRAG